MLQRRIAAAAVRATELLTEVLVTQTEGEMDTAARILSGIQDLGTTYHQLHEDLQAGHARITGDIAALREERRRDWEETTRQLSALRDRIDRMQRWADDRIRDLWSEIDALKHTMPEEVRAKLVELEMTMRDALERLGTLEAAELARQERERAAAAAAPSEAPAAPQEV